MIKFFKRVVQNSKYAPFFELLPCPYNRAIEPEKVQAIKAAITATGNIKPFVVCEVATDGGKRMMITDGHHRALALTELFTEGKYPDTLKVPIIVSDDKGVETAAAAGSEKIVHNANAWPKDYSCNFIESGAVSYEDVDKGVALLRREAIEKMLPSFIGKPVVCGIDKKTGGHVRVTPQNFKEFAVGYVTEVFFNQTDGWFYAKFILTDDDAKKLVEKGFSVSCAFDVKTVAPGGEWHSIKYDEEILTGEFTHLAIVHNPRYEDCKIYINSKGANKMFGLFKKKSKENEKPEDKKEEKMNMSEVFVDVDGEKVSCEKLLEHAVKPEEKPAEKKGEGAFEELEYEQEIADESGNKHKVADLVERYKAAKKNEKPADEKKNEEEKPADKKEDKPADEKKNEKPADEEEKPADKKDEEKPADKKDEKENDKKTGLKFFRKIENARHDHSAAVENGAILHETTKDKVERGNDKYGPAKKK